jgi:hypothetical protein
VRHYTYSAPLPSKGGTDAISVFHGMVLISASAPGTTGAAAPQPSYPAVYQVTFHPRHLIARIRPVFYGEARATVAYSGASGQVRLALTDPDSNEVVPSDAARFAGDFMLTSQGDKEQIFVRHPAMRRPALSVLRLSQFGRRHRVGHEPRWPAVRDRHRSRDRGRDHRAVHPRLGVLGGHRVRRERRPGHVPGTGLPGELPRRAEPVDRAHQPGAVGGAVLNPQGMLFESAAS